MPTEQDQRPGLMQLEVRAGNVGSSLGELAVRAQAPKARLLPSPHGKLSPSLSRTTTLDPHVRNSET